MGEGSSVLATLGTTVSFLLERFSAMATTLLAEPLFLISIGFFVIGGAIGLAKRIL